MLKIKLFVAFAFLALASCVFLFSSNKSQAQIGKTDERRDEVLEKVAGYKNWQQVQKPETKPDLSALKSDAVTILESTAMG